MTPNPNMTKAAMISVHASSADHSWHQRLGHPQPKRHLSGGGPMQQSARGMRLLVHPC
tara:strand:+ start:252 stop:425 length:174 start_codon:yes stop_codon:yes gene_type:complete